MKIACLLSGGVDSSLALALLKQKQYDIEAFYLKIWLEDENDSLADCPWQEDLEYIEKTCEQFDVNLNIIPLQQEYKKNILSYLFNEIQAGRTPNPDLLCNHRIKFGAFYKALSKKGLRYDKIATGHYANVEQKTSLFELFKSKDLVKDQSYFLSRLNQEQLAKALFPLAPYTKSQVRKLAIKWKLPSAKRKDSQGLCFLGKIRFSDFLSKHLADQSGEIIEYESKKTIGEHLGFWYYTIGQRKGLGLSGGPWFVIAKDVKRNQVYVSRNYYSPDKKRDCFYATDVHWISGKTPTNSELEALEVKLRHGTLAYHCEIEDVLVKPLFVRIKGCDQGIASGQFAVFYSQDKCLGCARISLPSQYLNLCNAS